MEPMTMKNYLLSTLVVLMASSVVFSQATTFQHRGIVLDNSGPVNGNYDLILLLHSTQTGQTQVGNHAVIPDVSIVNGVFTANVNFTAMPFTTQEQLYLEVRYSPAGSGQPHVSALNREPLLPSAFALRAHHATTASFAQSADSIQGIYPSNIIQNNQTGAPQPGVSINVEGSVSGSSVNSTSGYSINDQTVLSTSNGNLYAGELAGTNSLNSFLGNSFFGTKAGNKNVSGTSNSYFGYSAGSLSLSNNNSYFGYFAGAHNSTGGSNSFFGAAAGNITDTGSDNAFFGKAAAMNNSAGSYNSVIGSQSAPNLATGNGNSLIGFNSGKSVSTESYNTLLGNRADIKKGVTNSTAIGNLARVDVSNAVVLGSVFGVNGAESSSRVGIGTTTPQNALHVIDRGSAGLRVQTDKAGGSVASFGGNGAFQVDAPGVVGGRLNIQENGNTGVGTPSPAAKLHVNGSVRVDNGDLLALGGGGIVLRNSYGQCFRLQVNQSAQLVITGIFCP
jgi:hypothetical protein